MLQILLEWPVKHISKEKCFHFSWFIWTAILRLIWYIWALDKRKKDNYIYIWSQMEYFKKKSSSKENANSSQVAFFLHIVNWKLEDKIGKK